MHIEKPKELRTTTAPNRFAAFPMEANDAAVDGSPSTKTIERYRQLAAGGWGLIFIEATAATEEAKARPRQLLLNERTLDGFRRLIEGIRESAKKHPVVILQANHAGRYAIRPLLAYHRPQFDEQRGIQDHFPIATDAELVSAMKGIVSTCDLAARAGADGADVKCCHGYLAMDLMRPANTRTDRFGGDFEGRSRFLVETFREARRVAPKDFLLGCRISLQECFQGGFGSAANSMAFDPTEPAMLLERLSGMGLDFLCETAGDPYQNPEVVRTPKKHEAFEANIERHHALAKWAKSRLPGVPVIGGGYTLLGKDFVERAEKDLADGDADFIGFGRQTFADADLPRKALYGRIGDVKFCVGCASNNCSTLLRAGVEAGCVVYSVDAKRRMKEMK